MRRSFKGKLTNKPNPYFAKRRMYRKKGDQGRYAKHAWGDNKSPWRSVHGRYMKRKRYFVNR